MTGQPTWDAIDEEFAAGDAEMARRLLALNRPARPALLARVRAIPARPRPAARRVPRLAYAALAALLVFAGLVAVSPPLRAALGEVRETIGDVVLTVVDSLSIDSHLVRGEYRWVPPAEAPFEFSLPAAVPEGWVRQDEIGVSTLPDGREVLVRWTRPDHSDIYLSVMLAAEGEAPAAVVQANSYEQVDLAGRPGVVVHGGWDTDTREWGQPGTTAVLWTDGSLHYALWSAGPDVSQADLVTMAASVP